VVTTLVEVRKLVEASNQETLLLSDTVGDSQGKMGQMSQNLIGLKQYVVGSIETIHRKVSNLENSGAGTGSDSLGLTRLQQRLDELEDKARNYAKTSQKSDGTSKIEEEVGVLQRRMDKRDHDDKYDQRSGLGLGNSHGESNGALQD
jgi:hypothetical protein